MKIYFSLAFFFCIATALSGQVSYSNPSISDEINQYVKSSGLNYPKSVQRFYTKTNFRSAWILPQNEAARTWEAMLLLDCAAQFGLMQGDYHSTELSYDSLRMMINEPEKMSERDRLVFDVVLTDAMITFINHLHYGKLNPEYTQYKIDEGKSRDFSAEDVLISAKKEKDFMAAVLGVQPKVQAYVDFQRYLHLVKGLYAGDSYQVSESEVRQVSINMERLRWADFNDNCYIQINIPSYQLTFKMVDTLAHFKVIVGKPETQTAALQIKIRSLSTVSDRKKSHQVIVDEQYLVYPHNKKFHHLFDRKMRALSTGNVEVRNSVELAALLLKNDGAAWRVVQMKKAVAGGLKKDFFLKRPVAVKITYLTCEIKDGLPVMYRDIYQKDESLEHAFYKADERIALK